MTNKLPCSKAYDIRLSSPSLAVAPTDVFLQAGVNVLDPKIGSKNG